MAVQEQKGSNSLERYIAEVRSVWGDGKDPQLPFKVKALMEKLFASTTPMSRGWRNSFGTANHHGSFIAIPILALSKWGMSISKGTRICHTTMVLAG